MRGPKVRDISSAGIKSLVESSYETSGKQRKTDNETEEEDRMILKDVTDPENETDDKRGAVCSERNCS